MEYKKRTVIVVDDDEAFLGELCEALALSGYIPIPCPGAAGLRELAAKVRPAAIFLDVRLNGANGMDLAEEFARDPVTAQIPVIMMSGYFHDRDLRRRRTGANVNVCLEKPFSRDDAVFSLISILPPGN